MSMRKSIEEFWEQFLYNPEIRHQKEIPEKKFIIVCGMGGSHLSADILRTSGILLFVHQDYGLPILPKEILENSFFVVDSYSGNTEEMLDVLKNIREKGYPVGIITGGGKLLEIAEKEKITHIKLPESTMQPRVALGHQLLALAVMTKQIKIIQNIKNLTIPNTDLIKDKSKTLSAQLKDKTPLIYASKQNQWLAYYWKITLNETGKVPAFYNVFPELNHNELAGFSTKTDAVANRYHIVNISDETDHPRNKKRMFLTEKILKEKGVKTTRYTLETGSRINSILSSCYSAMWCALFLGESNNMETEEVPTIESLKIGLRE